VNNKNKTGREKEIGITPECLGLGYIHWNLKHNKVTRFCGNTRSPRFRF